MDAKNILLESSLDKSIFDIYFKGVTGQVKEYIEELPKIKVSDINKQNGNVKGVYILWKKDTPMKPIYVGRAQKQMIYQRIANHRSANARSSSFALHLLREKVASEKKNSIYLFPSYTGKKGKTTKIVEKILTKKIKIKDNVKNEIRNMECSWVEVCNPLHQAYLEILLSVELKTAPLDDIGDKNFTKEGENYRYLYYNSFNTS